MKKTSVTWLDEQCVQVQIPQKSKGICENSICESSIQVINDQQKVEDSNFQMNQNNLIYDQVITTTFNNESYQDLRIGEQHRQKWAEVQIGQKILKSSPNLTQIELNNQDNKSIKVDGEQKQDEKLQEEDLQELQCQTIDQTFQERGQVNETQDVNNSNQIVDRFFKGHQIQCRSNSRKGTRRIQSGEFQSLDQSKMFETSDLNNRSFSNSSRQHRGSYRFKPDDPIFAESGFKKKKNWKTIGGTKIDSQDSDNNEDAINYRSQKKIHRTSQEVWKKSFFHILIFFNRFIYRNKQKLIYFKPQELMKNQWNAINDLVQEFSQKLLGPIPIILPYNKISIFWDLVLIFFIFLNSFTIPFEICYADAQEISQFFSQLTRLVFMFEFVVQVNTAYYENGVLQKNRLKILFNYINSHLLIDTIAYSSLWLNHLGYPSLKIIFLIKYFSFYEIIEKIAESFQFSSKYHLIINILTLLLEIFMLCHLFACAWFKLGDYQQSIGLQNNWIAANNLVNTSMISQYISSIYFSIVTVGTIGYGDIVPKSDGEKVFISSMAIFTSIIFGYILMNIQNVYKEYYCVKKVYIKHLAQLNNYLFSRDVNPHLQQMARKYLKYVHTQNFQKGVHPNQTLNILSKFLREEITEEIFKRSIKNIPFLQQFSQQFLNALSLKMKEVSYGPDEMIMKSGSYHVPQLYYILKGKVEVYLDQSNKQNLKQNFFSEYQTFYEYKENQSFGQYEFISQVHQSSINAKSLEITTVHQIALTDFIEVINQFSIDKEKYLELKDKLNLNENFQCAKVYCQSCKSSQHILKDCPLFFYKPAKHKIIRFYNLQQEDERKSIKRSLDRLVLNSLAFQQEIEDDCLFFREENEEELGSMIQIEPDLQSQSKKQVQKEKKSQDMFSLNIPQVEKLGNGSRISINIPRSSFQLNNQGNSQQLIQTENKIVEQENEDSKTDFPKESAQEAVQMTLNSIKKDSSKSKLDNDSQQSSFKSSTESQDSSDDQYQSKQSNKNLNSRKSLNDCGFQNQKSRVPSMRVNNRQEFQKKATLLSARTKKNWNTLEKNQTLIDVNLQDYRRPSQLLLNDPKLATQVKQNYKRLITIGQMQQVLEIMHMQNAQKVVKQIIEHKEDIPTETVRTFKIYMTHNNIGSIIKQYQKFKMKERLKKKIVKSADIDNPFIIKQFANHPPNSPN
ncbi:cation channel family protein (macronuclear) [Tetrahymena thermophila SB210]|uniref:Cation channel family protein n=1 Tax=Tetrahymena thermophila (strain SB210) TaxID=312017 RepID=I7MEV9_TETTS|nr:cation channel family protein [Tetrahymena thermophila SB210]EAR97897.2 cation channel family protein [Tetrahymena thermophila SB210]|eukprot:XP_001018142.2 cation channel family protein [Tetrahymena thermophila SB210]